MSRRGATHADESGPSRRRRRDEAEDLEDDEDEREEEEGNENVDPEDTPPTKTPVWRQTGSTDLCINQYFFIKTIAPTFLHVSDMCSPHVCAPSSPRGHLRLLLKRFLVVETDPKPLDHLSPLFF